VFTSPAVPAPTFCRLCRLATSSFEDRIHKDGERTCHRSDFAASNYVLGTCGSKKKLQASPGLQIKRRPGPGQRKIASALLFIVHFGFRKLQSSMLAVVQMANPISV